MKKRRLKGWVVNTLAVIGMISLIVMGSDSDNMKVFLITHIVSALVFCMVGYILIKNKEE